MVAYGHVFARQGPNRFNARSQGPPWERPVPKLCFTLLPCAKQGSWSFQDLRSQARAWERALTDLFLLQIAREAADPGRKLLRNKL